MLLAAYPHELYRGRPSSDQIVTVDWDHGAGWPNTVVGPDPQNVEAASTFLAQLMAASSPAGTRRLIVPLCEEAVLACGLATTKLGLDGVDLETAIRCTSRLAQRQALPKHLNPSWWRADAVPGFVRAHRLVVKAAASQCSLEVRILHSGPITPVLKELERRAYLGIARLRRVGVAPVSIVEDYADGGHYEVSGISRDRVAHTFTPLRQLWDSEERRILGYREAPSDTDCDLRLTAYQAVQAIGLSWCGWCVEIKGPPWVVIEVHARLGEDEDYYPHLDAEMDPVERLFQVLGG